MPLLLSLQVSGIVVKVYVLTTIDSLGKTLIQMPYMCEVVASVPLVRLALARHRERDACRYTVLERRRTYL